MDKIEQIVTGHYGVGNLAQKILDALTATGIDLDHLTIGDLGIIDEFHIGGRKATEHLISKMSLSGGDHVLDVGSGIGGPARLFSALTGCRVTGIDLTPDYVEAAKILTRMTGMDEKVEFDVASALAMPFGDETFDAAITIHVAMNIIDRDALYKEIARVLKPGAKFCLYDVMKKSDDPIVFPVPWASGAGASHLITAEETASRLDNAGFDVGETEDRSEFAFDYFDRRIAAVTGVPSPLGPQLIMGETAREKFQNIRHNMKCGRIAPVQMIAVRCP